MKKTPLLFFFFVFINMTACIEYEIFEYSIRDIRMRKKLQSITKRKEIIAIDKDEYTSASDQKSIQDIQSTNDLITIKNLEIIHEKKEATSPQKKINKNQETASVKEIPQKKAPNLQKKFDILALEPVITKQSENHLDNQFLKSSMTISIQNNISQEMITYHHWSGSYTPEFSVVINETTIPNNIDLAISCEQPLKIEYKALFPYGYSSADYVYYEPKKSVKKIMLEFDWHKTPRIIITEVES